MKLERWVSFARVLVFGVLLSPVGQGIGRAQEPLPFLEFTFSRQSDAGFGSCVEEGDIFSARIRADARADPVRFRMEVSVVEEGEPAVDECIEGLPGCKVARPAAPRFLTGEEVERVTATVPRILLEERREEVDPICPLWDPPCHVGGVFSLDDFTIDVNLCTAPHLTFSQSIELVELLESLWGAVDPGENGDVNADGKRNITDAVYVLQHLFAGGPSPVPLRCVLAPACPPEELVIVENGDVNGDGELDISDPGYLLNWLFGDGAAPVTLCVCAAPADCEDCDAPARCVPDSFDSVVCTADLVTCDGIRAVYDFLTLELGSLCGEEGECHIVLGDCAIGLPGCHFALNTDVERADLAALARRFQDLGCRGRGPICRCALPPDRAICADGRCRRGG